jgi:hypothetical protein
VTTTHPAPRPGRRASAPLVALLAGLALLGATPSTAGADGIFLADCRLSHRASDDPIVFPRMPGASHLHDFFGNRSTKATSTTRSLLRSSTTCTPSQDRSAYWVPSLYRDGRLVRPTRFQAYYRDVLRYGRVLPFPTGLRVVAGSPMPKAPQRGIVRWTCNDDHGTGSPSRIPACGSRLVTLRISFPDCWDGRRLDSPDHKAHMAYNRAGGLESGLQRCPRSHPVVVPELQLNVVYPLRDGRGVRLSSGPVGSAHGDVFNAWRPKALRRQVDGVLNAGRACAPFLGCTTLTGPSDEPVTARPRRTLVDRLYPPPGHG